MKLNIIKQGSALIISTPCAECGSIATLTVPIPGGIGLAIRAVKDDSTELDVPLGYYRPCLDSADCPHHGNE